MSKDARNPTIIPKPDVGQAPACPKCGSKEFDGFGHDGVVTRTCRKCKNKWQGGLPQSPLAPGEYLPPDSYVPPVRFEPSLDPKKKSQLQEIDRKIDTRPEFKKGLPEGEGGEEL
jgi:hypothetical protein